LKCRIVEHIRGSPYREFIQESLFCSAGSPPVHGESRNLPGRDRVDLRRIAIKPIAASSSDPKGDAMMSKTFTVLATAATLTIAAVAAPQPAEARGGRVAAGIIGGLAAGAIIGGALAGGGGYYGPGPGYGYYGSGYYAPRYGYGPGYGYGYGYAAAPVYYGGGCTWRRQRVMDPYGYSYVRRVRVCY
jgi:hypothetical protein